MKRRSFIGLAAAAALGTAVEPTTILPTTGWPYGESPLLGIMPTITPEKITSFWQIHWSKDAIHMLYPKGSYAGLPLDNPEESVEP